MLMNSEVFSIGVIVCESFYQFLRENIFLFSNWQRLEELENFPPCQEIAGFGIVKVAPSLAKVPLKTTREVIHLDTALEQGHLSLASL